jgi:hypothetical protein
VSVWADSVQESAYIAVKIWLNLTKSCRFRARALKTKEKNGMIKISIVRFAKLFANDV